MKSRHHPHRRCSIHCRFRPTALLDGWMGWKSLFCHSDRGRSRTIVCVPTCPARLERPPNHLAFPPMGQNQQVHRHLPANHARAQRRGECCQGHANVSSPQSGDDCLGDANQPWAHRERKGPHRARCQADWPGESVGPHRWIASLRPEKVTNNPVQRH